MIAAPENHGGRLEEANTALGKARAEFRSLSDREAPMTVAGLKLGIDLSDELRAKAVEDYLPTLESAERLAEKAASIARSNATAVARQTASAPPILSPEETALASNRAVFVREDAERLALPTLVERVRHAFQSEDRSALYLYLRYGRARLAVRVEGQRDPAEVAARAELGRLMSAAEERLRDPALAPVAKAANEALVRAGEVSRLAVERRREVARERRRVAEGLVAW